MLYPKFFIAVITTCLISSIVQSQPIVPPNKIFVIIDHEVWDLKSDGKIEIFNIDEPKNKRAIAAFTHKIVNSIAKDRYENVYVSVNDGHLFRLIKNDTTWKDVTPLKFNAGYDFVINSNGKVFQVTHDGIIDTETGKAYVPDKAFCFSEYRLREGLFGGWDDQERPSLMLDHSNRLWFVVSYGEWGDDPFCFDTEKHSFVKITGDMVNILGSFHDAGDKIFAAGGGVRDNPYTQFGFLSYFSDLSSEGKDTVINHPFYITYNNPGHDKLMREQKGLYPADYCGSVEYNPADRMIYFYCKFGLYKGDPQKSLSDITKWSKVSAFKLQPQDVKRRIHQYLDIPSDKDTSKIDMQEDYDVNMPYAFRQIAFTVDGKLVFITYHDGLGIFDGQKITILDSGSSF